MSWNYRVIRMKRSDGSVDYAFHEVYYDKDNKPRSVTENAVSPYGESVEELERVLERFKRALKEPVLDYDDF